MCPCCRRMGLYPTGNFWQCDACGLRVTRQALDYERKWVAASLEQAEEHRHGPKTVHE